MIRLASIDAGQPFDWGKTSADYAQFRAGPPPSFYARLAALGIGLPGQQLLDLGTGTGVLARQFAQQGCRVWASDISLEQIAAARELARAEGLSIDFRVAAAEAAEFEPQSFDVATANQCWLYFDHARVIEELRRVLRPGGVLVTSHFAWLPRRDAIAHASEALVLRFNPKWSAADWSGEIAPIPQWAEGRARLRNRFVYDEPIAFTREIWRGRVRACRGVAAALSVEDVRRFDEAHAQLLERTTPEQFTILHRIDAHIFELL